jgi:hypothetical protein
LNEKLEPIRNRRLDLPPPSTGRMGSGMGGGIGGMGGGFTPPTPYPDLDLMLEARNNMPRTGNCAVAMLLGLVAAMLGQRAYDHSRRVARGDD